MATVPHNVYDPDPTDLQMEVFESVSSEKLTLADFSSNPQTVQLLIHNQIVNIAQLKALQAEVVDFRTKTDQLRDDRENLRIQVARLEGQSRATLLEIPISFISGFAINILSSDLKSPLGWFLLIISLIMLIFLRGEDLLTLINRKTTKESLDA